MEKKSLLDSVRNVSISIVFLAILLIAFSVVSIISELGSDSGESITGNVIVIKGSGYEENVSIEDGKVSSELNDNLICWIEGGLNEEDLIVIGHLLRDIDCPKGEKRNVDARIEGDCVVLDIENEASAKVCPEGLKPVINLELVSLSKDQLENLENVPRKNYYVYILFLIAVTVVLLSWREYELSIKTDLESKAEEAYLKRRNAKRKAFKKALEDGKIRQKEKKEKVVYLNPAPIYDEKKAARDKKAKDALKNKIKKEAEKKEREKAVERNELVTEFNSESEKINKLIISGKLKESRKNYLNLFETYSQLTKIVSERNRKKLDSVMQYLCHYLGALEKIKGTSRKSISQKLIDEDAVTIKAKPKLIDMSQLEKMKNLINEKNYAQAKRLFYNASSEERNLPKIKSRSEKDVLDNIEMRHDKIMKKGVVNVAEEDYYRFMSNMTALRKELKKRKSTRTKKKS
ncbi:hypothetical protein HOM13_00965 [Candidatus Woesearchaeota archaeon]|jgi:hypothetical protein|nr:hypothetical protein [Candidatus Woesearchaeota archaeon]MBT5215288.1 hypothetical protein [Candidatus Woesearchaeota archaeon]MBT6402732.1 hypothetical protein [Candidatus Woesearchaeota archaeon]